jgi:hypothetical protein
VTDSQLSANAAEETDSAAARGPAAGAYPGTPRWVKLGAIIAIVLILLVVVAMALSGGEHGPFRHIPSGSGMTLPIAVALIAAAT